MQDAAQNLPENPIELRVLLRRAQAELLDTRAELHAVKPAVKRRDRELKRLTLQLAKLRRLQFGRSSEKRARQIQQLELRLEELETLTPEQVPAEQAGKAEPRKPVLRA